MTKTVNIVWIGTKTIVILPVMVRAAQGLLMLARDVAKYIWNLKK